MQTQPIGRGEVIDEAARAAGSVSLAAQTLKQPINFRDPLARDMARYIENYEITAARYERRRERQQSGGS